MMMNDDYLFVAKHQTIRHGELQSDHLQNDHLDSIWNNDTIHGGKHKKQKKWADEIEYKENEEHNNAFLFCHIDTHH